MTPAGQPPLAGHAGRASRPGPVRPLARIGAGDPMLLGRAGLAAIAVSIAGTVAVGAAGPSLMEPPLPGAPARPGPAWLPWALDLRLSPYLAVGVAAVSLAAGTLGLVLTLRAMRLGWTGTPRYVLLAGVAAAIVAGTTRPFGTSDFLSYAAYGHELMTGHNPYLVAPRALPGDPVARAVQDWAGTPSVYGALATGVFGAASLLGGASARLTVFVLDLVNALAFIVTGVLLYRLARGPAARLRAAVLWTCNPLLLQILVAGSHVDGLAAAFSIGGIAVLSEPDGHPGSGELLAGGDRDATGPRPSRAVAAGILLGLGFAVKPTVLLVALGSAAAVTASSGRPRLEGARALAGLGAGFAAVAVADLVLMGSAGIAQTSRASGLVSVGSPWRVVRTVLALFMGSPGADVVVRWCAVALAVFLAAALLRRIRPGGLAAFALVLAWLTAWPYVLPWYDALAWAMLPLLPASGLDWLLLARTAALGFGYLPARSAGITIPGGLRWMEPVLRSAVTPAVLAAVLAGLVWWSARPGGPGRRGPRGARRGYGMMGLCVMPISARKERLPRQPWRAWPARGVLTTWSRCRIPRSARPWRPSGRGRPSGRWCQSRVPSRASSPPPSTT